ncbi:MAG: coniferyl-alcohol dehydrogenase [Paracoccaceae bacterium]
MGTYAITGVVSGIGAKLARVLQGQGHRVIGLDLAEPENHVDRYIPIDLSDPDSIQAAVGALDEDLDGLCNNAGLPPRDGLEAKILQVNFFGPRRFTHAVLDRLKPGGSIVNTASRAGQFWQDNLDQIKRLSAVEDPASLAKFLEDDSVDPTRAYNLSKEAVIAWTLAETEPLIAKGLRMNTVSPAAVATGILDDFVRAFGERVAKNIERAGRAGRADEVADVAAFLLSPASGWLKGTDIWIDGGMAAFNGSDAMGLDVLRG